MNIATVIPPQPRRSFINLCRASVQSMCLSISAIGLIAGLPSCSALGQKTAMQPADIVHMKRVETPMISPDGKLVAYTVDTPVAPGKHRNAHLWLAPTDRAGAARPFTTGDAAESEPAWSPDGTHLAFLSDRGNPLASGSASPFRFSIAPGTERKDVPVDAEKKDAESVGMQLWWIALDGGEAEPLTNIAGGIRAFKWSPDGKSIAFVRTDTDTPEEKKRKEAKSDHTLIDREYHFDRLWIYDLAGRQARLVTTADRNIDTVDWSPDGATIVSRVSPTPRLDDYWRVSKVLLIDTKTGAITRTLEERSGYATPTFSRDGQWIAFSRFTPRGITDSHFVKNLSDGKEINLEAKLAGTIREMHWSGAGSKLLVSQIVATHYETTEVDVATFATKPVAGMPLSSEEFELTPDGRSFTFLSESPEKPQEAFVWHDGHALGLSDTNPQASGWKLGTEREIEWKNPKDHHTVYGVVVLPPDYQTGTRYKTIVHIHGGPEEAWTIGFNGNWYNYAALLASQGYVVLLPDPRGSEGQGPAFTEANFQDWGGGDFADIMAGVDYLVAQGISDPDKLAVGGWSFGGFMTAWTVTHTNRFKAGMVGAGVTDLYSMATTTDIAPSFEQGYMGDLQKNMAVYDAHSPVRFVNDCHTPVLVLHGEADPRVPLSQGQEFYHGLRFLNRETQMVTYPREPHIFTEEGHQIDSLTRILGWYDAHLGK